MGLRRTASSTYERTTETCIMASALRNHTDVTPPHLRYSFKPPLGSSHHWALSQLSQGARHKRILDVGPGIGWLGESLKTQQPDSLVTVEIDRRAHDHLRNHYEEVYTDLEELQGRTFDVIAALDLLEHLPNPAEYLAKLRSMLAPGGVILVSVPNIAHWSVRIPLFLWGSFRYSEIGILDHSHLRFFCRSSFRELCRSLPDARLAQLSVSIEPAELVLPLWVSKSFFFRWSLPIRYWLAQRMPGLLGYQHLARIESTI